MHDDGDCDGRCGGRDGGEGGSVRAARIRTASVERRWKVGRALGQIELGCAVELQIATLRAQKFLGTRSSVHLPTAGETNIVRLSIIYTWLIYPIVSRHLAY